MMNKRIFAYVITIFCFLIGMSINYGYAQEYTQDDMNAVSVRFCDNGTGETTHDTAIYTESGKQKQLCLFVLNGGTKKVEFEYGFSRSMVDMGRTCDGDMSAGNAFSILIPQTQERKIIINPGESKIIKENVVVSPGMSGLQMGCLLYKLGTPTSLGSMFILETRKYGYIDIIIGSEADVISDIRLLDNAGGIFSTKKTIKANLDTENNLSLGFLMGNSGNVSQNITITGKVYNVLGFQKEFVINTTSIAPGSTHEFVADVGILPAYKGLFTVKYTIKSDPIFLFPVQNEKLKQSKYIIEKGQIFMFSRFVVILLIVMLFILYRALPKRRRSETTPIITTMPSTTPTA